VKRALSQLDNPLPFLPAAQIQSATMTHMRHSLRFFLALIALSCLSASLVSQGTTGSLALTATMAPTGAQPEPIRQFTFYVLTKSYADVVKEVEGADVLPTRDQFIENLKCSPEMKSWIKAHDIVDLTSPDVDKLLTVNDIMNVPEFFAAYERSNSGGVTKGFPLPKYRESDKESNPERYQKQKQEFLAATRKFIETNPNTVQGIELELSGVNPKTNWDNLHAEHRRKVAQQAPDTAQVKYLAAKTQTDLDGHGFISGLPAGNYWVSTLGNEATSGDRRLAWDVPVSIQPGQATRVDLSNLNATDNRKLSSP